MKKRYPKIISACCFLFVFVNVGLPSTSFSVYQPYLVAIPGVGDAGGSLILSIRTLVTLVAMLFVNHYYNRLDCRVAVTLGCLLTAAGFLLYGLADSLFVFCAGAVCAGLGYGLGGNVGMTLLTGRWYKSHVGTAVGFATVGSGLAGMVVPPLALHIIEGLSLSMAFFAESAFSFAVAILVFALIRNHPADIGSHPYEADGGGESQRYDSRGVGDPSTPGATAPSAQDDKHGGADALAQDDKHGGPDALAQGGKPGNRGELPARARILLFMAMTGVGIMSVGALAYLSILMTTCGYSPLFAAAMLSLVGGCLTAAKFVSGVLFDRIGVARATTVIFASSVIGLALCCCMPSANVPIAIVAAVAYGAGVSAGSVGISVWSIAFSNEATRSKMVKDFQVGYALGGFIGDTFPGLLAHATATYVSSYAIILATTALSGVIIIAMYRAYCR